MISTMLIALLASTGVNDQQVAMNTAKAPVAAVEGGAMPTPQAKKAKKATKYCVDQAYTGSRLPVRMCNTRDDWLAMGWDPLDPK